jgi:hypothetical protein
VDLPLWYAYCDSRSYVSLFIVFKKKDVRLMDLNDIASSYESRPGLGINITLTALHANVCVYAKHADFFFVKWPMIISVPCCSRPGNISSSPAALKVTKPSIAYFTL